MPGMTAHTTVQLPNGCWGLVNRNRKGDALRRGGSKGYVVMSVRGKQVKAHRHIYELWRGPIPAGLQIDHLCRNPSCVNPGHLEAVTAWENQARSTITSVGKTHCPQGHPYAGENLRIERTKLGYCQRRCVTCARQRGRKKAQPCPE